MSILQEMDLSAALPSESWSEPVQALWWLKKGDLKMGAEWDKAHEICQRAEGEPIHDWVHGLCHLIEGDTSNAAYWFRSAGRSPASADPDAIWEEILSHLR